MKIGEIASSWAANTETFERGMAKARRRWLRAAMNEATPKIRAILAGSPRRIYDIESFRAGDDPIRVTTTHVRPASQIVSQHTT